MEILCLFGGATEITLADLREEKEKGEASTLAKEVGTSPFQPKTKIAPTRNGYTLSVGRAQGARVKLRAFSEFPLLTAGT